MFYADLVFYILEVDITDITMITKVNQSYKKKLTFI